MLGVERIGDSVWINGLECTIEQAKKLRRQLTAALKAPKEQVKYAEDSIPYRLARKYFEIIRLRNKEIKEPDFQKWARQVELMINQDKRNYMEIYHKMVAVQSDEFWQNNVLSTDKLRKRWNEGKLDRLRKQADDDAPSVRFAQ